MKKKRSKINFFLVRMSLNKILTKKYKNFQKWISFFCNADIFLLSYKIKSAENWKIMVKIECFLTKSNIFSAFLIKIFILLLK